MGALAAAAWLLGLLAAAPVFRTSERYELPDRLRDALVLGVAIPGGLAYLHLLYPAACWLGLAAALAVAYRRGTLAPASGDAAQPPHYLLIAALALVAWPQLIRLPFDGDSLSYHLPNAAAWVHAHGFWTTDARYWWYPPASESFAAGLFAVSGPRAIAWCGFGALALLGFRIAAWTRDEFALSPFAADALAAALVTAAPVALQAGSLQNDVWLAAFFLEALWTARRGDDAARTLAVTALLKPFGWFFALTAAFTQRAAPRAWLAATVAIALWIVHDATLWHTAIVAPASTSTANTWQSTILAHGVAGIALMLRVCFQASPFAAIALLAAFAGPWLAPPARRSIGWAACIAAVWFVVMPLAYADAHPQLAAGTSLRFADPAFAIGTLLLARPVLRLGRAAVALLVLSAAAGAGRVVALFYNDAPTRTAVPVAALAVANAALARKLRSAWPLVAGVAVAVIVSWWVWIGPRKPAEFFADLLAVGGKPSGVYAWIERTQPPVVGGWGLRLGTVNVLAPHARTIDLPDDAACAVARAQHALLIAVAEETRPARFNARRLAGARTCGRVRYDDGSAVVAGF